MLWFNRVLGITLLIYYYLIDSVVSAIVDSSIPVLGSSIPEGKHFQCFWYMNLMSTYV